MGCIEKYGTGIKRVCNMFVIVSPQKNGISRTYGWGELEQIPPVDAIIHLAGKAHDLKNSSDPQSYFAYQSMSITDGIIR